MLDATCKKLLRFLRPDASADLRSAAALVLGEAGVRESEISQAILTGLDDEDPAFRLQCLIAAGKLRIEPALPRLLERVQLGGPEADFAAQAVARLGAKGTKALRDLMPRTAPGLRRRIAAAMAGSGSSSAETAAIDSLLDTDPGVVDAAARSLMAEIPSLAADHRKALTAQLLELLTPKKNASLVVASRVAAVRLLAALGEPKGETILWDAIQPGQPAELRAVALQALGRVPVLAVPNTKLKRLFACAADADFRVAAPALMMLKAFPVETKTVPEWLALLEAPDVAVRRLALEKIGDRDVAGVAAALLAQLSHRDRSLRDDALSRLVKLKQGRIMLIEALLESTTPDDAWTLARALAPHFGSFAANVSPRIAEAAFQLLEAGDRRADPLLFLLREADPRSLRDRLEERALVLRKKEKYETASIYLRLLARDPACAASVRCELAACALHLCSHDLAADARAAEPTLQQFAGLIHHHEADLLAFMKAAKWLDPEDLFYLGFHFIEKDKERKFGGEMLRLLIQRSPRSKLAKDAKAKLRREGVE